MKSKVTMTLSIAVYLGITIYTLAAVHAHDHVARTAVAALGVPR